MHKREGEGWNCKDCIKIGELRKLILRGRGAGTGRGRGEAEEE